MIKYLFLIIFLFHAFKSSGQNIVQYIWSGGVTSNSATVNAKLYNQGYAYLLISQHDDFAYSICSDSVYVTDSTFRMASFSCTNLEAGTKYYYTIEQNSIREKKNTGSIITYPDKPTSFSFVVSACSGNSNHKVYGVMKEQQPLFYINSGDLHYADPTGTTLESHTLPYEQEVLSKPEAAAFFKQVPICYVWDDHDFCGNGSSGLSPGKFAAKQAYDLYVPHYPFPLNKEEDPICQEYKVGRVKFLLSDVRSQRLHNTMLGNKQKEWLMKEIKESAIAGEMVIWVSPVSFSGDRADNWGGFEPERVELSNFFRDNAISNLMIICGDAHMLAIDDGTHSDFSSDRSNPNRYPILQAAALNRHGSYKGGIFSEGVFPNPAPFHGQFAKVTVEDNNSDEICIEINGYRVNDLTAETSIITEYQFCRKVTLGPQYAIYPNPAMDIVNIQIRNIKPDAKGKYSIVDLLGRVVGSGHFNSNEAFTGIQVNTNHLIKGFYTVYVEIPDNSFGIKLVIHR